MNLLKLYLEDLKNESDSEFVDGAQNGGTSGTAPPQSASRPVTAKAGGCTTECTKGVPRHTEMVVHPLTKKEMLVQLQFQIEQLWQSRTPASLPVPDGYDADQLCSRVEIQLEKWWQEEPETQMMSCMVLPANKEFPTRINLYRVSYSANFKCPRYLVKEPADKLTKLPAGLMFL